MLFLLNDEVLDLGDPETCLIDTLGVIGLRHDRLTPLDAVEMGQELYFRLGRGKDPVRNVRLAIAAMVALKLEADAAMFIVPASARSYHEVKVRFTIASSELLSNMHAIQSAKGSLPKMMAESLWRQAA